MKDQHTDDTDTLEVQVVQIERITDSTDMLEVPVKIERLTNDTDTLEVAIGSRQSNKGSS